MRRGWLVYAALLAAPVARGEESGWVVLFDGKTMANWDDPRQKTPPGDAWTIDDGCLKANRRPHIVLREHDVG